MSDSNDTKNPPSDQKYPGCTCMQDAFDALPPELRPQKKTWKAGLRKTTCIGCGLIYWTNQEGDVCMNCQKKGVQSPQETKQE